MANNSRQHNKECRAKAQANHLLQYIQIKTNILGQKMVSINLKEAGKEMKQSFIQVERAITKLAENKDIDILNKHKIGKEEVFYTVKLN